MEYVDIYTAERQRTGRTAERGSKLDEGEYRLIVHAAIFNRAGELLIQQRQPFKKGWGGLWDLSMGGAVSAGETSAQALVRELQEELGLAETDLEGLTLRYVTHRLMGGEIRQNYYFFGRLKTDRELSSTEGNLRWVPFEEVQNLEMPVSAKHMILHYLAEGRFTEELYCGITEETGTRFVPMKEF